MRLDKYLSDMGVGTRSELKKEIKKGSVCVDGAVVKDPGRNVTEASHVTFRGAEIVYEEYVYYMLRLIHYFNGYFRYLCRKMEDSL